MEMMITGRNLVVSDRFREYADEKVAKIEQLATKAQRLDIKVTKETKARQSDTQLTVEISVVGRGPAIRAEAKAPDKFAAFDIAFSKLLERLRRARDRKKVHHGRQTPTGVSEATSSLEPASTTVPLHVETVREQAAEAAAEEKAPESPVEIRRKVFPATPMSVDDAVDRMEMVGHPFYLFMDDVTGEPAVVYRRKGWSYGIISLDSNCSDEETVETRHYREAQRQAAAATA
ncbi:ribosome hibernation-promoting factor, HPF/YfiA family [Arthrobacter halodurans]|jgi:ribosomal subunit interface protein|uniref:Ribosome hibernation promoting factor n=1 Tax=Arthrobacter halodurans TaxID=516699 RepID=A0ABV4UKF3_9MICC